MTCLMTRIVRLFFDVASAAANFLVAEFYCTCTRELLPDCPGLLNLKSVRALACSSAAIEIPMQNP
jgi:hypothetical protein